MTGHINRGSILGELIYNLVQQPDIMEIVEIGTWNGLGSTKCVIDGLIGKDNYRFTSIESSPEMYAEALKNVGNIPGVELLLGRIIDPINIPPLVLNDTQKGWLQEDLDHYLIVPNVLECLPDKIDLIIFDGGEFTSELEFDLISERSRYIILDDTNAASGSIKFKNVTGRIFMGETPFTVIRDNQKDRNGWLLAEKL